MEEEETAGIFTLCNGLFMWFALCCVVCVLRGARPPFSLSIAPCPCVCVCVVWQRRVRAIGISSSFPFSPLSLSLCDVVVVVVVVIVPGDHQIIDWLYVYGVGGSALRGEREKGKDVCIMETFS